jgi:phosphoheptose isomerase
MAERWVVLDRDGTLLVKHDYLGDPARVELLPSAAPALRRLREIGCGLVVITNQSGIARGLFDAEQLERVHARMIELLAAEGLSLDGIFVCPHHPDDGCACRKPRTGLLEQAGRELGFAPRDVFIVGDDACDVDLGHAVGAMTVLVLTGEGAAVASRGTPAAHFQVADVGEAADLIAALMERRSGTAERVRRHLRESAELKLRIGGEPVAHAAELIVGAFRRGGKLLLCGNGGSAADCQHLAGELMGRMSRDRDRDGFPAVALTTDTSFLTAQANDCGYQTVFERQVLALGRPGDVLLAISTSGNSANVILAAQAARRLGMRVIALTGTGGQLGELADVTIAVPSQNVQHIQECHLALEHALCDLIESA